MTRKSSTEGTATDTVSEKVVSLPPPGFNPAPPGTLPLAAASVTQPQDVTFPSPHIVYLAAVRNDVEA